MLRLPEMQPVQTIRVKTFSFYQVVGLFGVTTFFKSNKILIIFENITQSRSRSVIAVNLKALR